MDQGICCDGSPSQQKTAILVIQNRCKDKWKVINLTDRILIPNTQVQCTILQLTRLTATLTSYCLLLFQLIYFAQNFGYLKKYTRIRREMRYLECSSCTLANVVTPKFTEKFTLVTHNLSVLFFHNFSFSFKHVL